METTVTLRPPFEYSLWVLLVGIAIFAAFLFAFIWVLSKILGIERGENITSDNESLSEVIPTPFHPLTL